MRRNIKCKINTYLYISKVLKSLQRLNGYLIRQSRQTKMKDQEKINTLIKSNIVEIYSFKCFFLIFELHLFLSLLNKAFKINV